MRHFFTFLTFLCILGTGMAGAQDGTDTQFGIIPDSLFRMPAPSGDSAAPYLITNKEVDVSFRQTNGNIIAVLEHHMRLKVFDASAREASMVTIPYYYDENMEQISGLRGLTHLPSGKEVSLDPETIKTIDINGRYKVKEFEMPAVRDGAVLEYRYVISRRYIEELPDFYLNQRVPTAHARVSITYPQYLRYEGVVENFDGPLQHTFAYRDTSSVPKIFTLPRPEPVVTERWVARDIPPVQEEAYISSLDDYRGKIKFILKAFGLPRQQLDISWAVVVAKLRRNTNPLTEIRDYGRARALGDSIASAHPGEAPQQIQDRIFSFVNDQARFSGSYAPYSSRSDTEVLSGQAVDQAAINQTLLAMLRGAGIEAHPLLTSTRSSGRINRDFPSFYQFNALAVQSKIEGQTYLMDASFAYSQPNLLPVEINNGEGLLLREDSFTWIPMRAENSRVDIQVQVDGQLQADGTLRGEVVSFQRGYPAQLIRQQKANGRSDAEVLRRTLFDGYGQIRLNDVTIREFESYSGPVEVRGQFEIENYAASFTDGLRFRPMVVGYQRENPFKDTSRDLPITLTAPEQLEVHYNIELPRGFEAENTTQGNELNFPGAHFQESYAVERGTLSYDYKIDIERQNFAVDQFEQLYALYERWVELSNSYWMIER